jgi:hypothetical protein
MFRSYLDQIEPNEKSLLGSSGIEVKKI